MNKQWLSLSFDSVSLKSQLGNRLSSLKALPSCGGHRCSSALPVRSLGEHEVSCEVITDGSKHFLWGSTERGSSGITVLTSSRSEDEIRIRPVLNQGMKHTNTHVSVGPLMSPKVSEQINKESLMWRWRRAVAGARFILLL